MEQRLVGATWIAYLRIVPVFVVGAIIFYFSSLSNPFPTPPPGKSGFLDLDTTTLLHVGEFGLFAMCVCLALWDRDIPRVSILAVGVAWAVIDEFHQYFIPNRYFDVLDILADLIGILLGIFGYYLLTKIWDRYRRDKSSIASVPFL